MLSIHNVKMFFISLSVFLAISLASAADNNLPLLEYDAIVFPEIASSGMVATQDVQATEVGVSILQQGGNAVDAAVAIGFTLAVTLPRAGNIGGGGFMLVYDVKTKQVNALDYREKAPQSATRDMFLNRQLEVDNTLARHSIFSSGVPGTVAGLVEAHRKYGSLPLAVLLRPAIQLAKGMPISYAMAQSLNLKQQYLSKDEESKKVFTKANGDYWKAGDIIKQSDLATTLSLIASSSGQDFYTGTTAKKLAKFFEQKKGLITLKDLADYRAIWRAPISTRWSQYQLFSMPPPSSGGVHLVQLLNILKEFPLDKAGANSAYESHLKTEAMKFAYADRSLYLGDPDFVDVPTQKLTSIDYAKSIAKQISIDKVIPSSKINPGMFFSDESPQTTHFSVMDQYGNIVSNTYTLNFSFGSGITATGTGVLLNNEMDDFSAKPGTPNGYGLLGGEANAIAPEKRPLSAMTPVIVLENGKPWLATGSPGGSRIITIVLNFLLNRIVHNMNIAEATITPRIHHQWYPDKLSVEKGFPVDTTRILQTMGHNVEYRNPWGSLQSVEYKDGLFLGFADQRRPGALAKGVDLSN